MAEPLAYFITFTCYGNWLHGVNAAQWMKNTTFLAPLFSRRTHRNTHIHKNE